jgi:hypothetical protein
LDYGTICDEKQEKLFSMSKNRGGHGRTVLGEKVTRLIFPMPLQLMHLRLNTIMCRTNPRRLTTVASDVPAGLSQAVVRVSKTAENWQR